MRVLKKMRVIAVATIIVIGGVHINERFDVSPFKGFVSSAEARVGRPLTPVSVAGVARRSSRRTARRCANGTYNC